MKMGTICLGLAICSLAGMSNFAQEEDTPNASTSVSATAETETDVTVEKNGKGKRKMRVERRLPGGQVEIEEFNDDIVRPNVRRRIEVIEDQDDGDDTYEHRVEVRPQIRVFPREKEMVIRRGPGQRDMRIELDAGEPMALRRELRTGVSRRLAEDEPAEASIEHLQEAIRHLKKAKMAEMAGRLEGELRELKARRKQLDSELNEQLRSLREERDALRDEIRKLREEVQKQNRGGTKKPVDAEEKE